MIRPVIRVLALAVFAVSLSACGGGGGGSVSAPAGATLVITTTALPGGTTQSPYPVTQLQSVGAEGGVEWTLDAGTLPNGIDFAPDGFLTGTPTANGTYDFSVRATDDASTTTAALSIVISDLELIVTAGLQFGDAWSQAPVSLSVAGTVETVSFSAVTNASVGVFSNVDAQAGTAVWTPGPNVDVTDVLRATETGTGRVVDLRLDVEPNPVIDHVADFGSNDVWWIEFDSKRGNHAYASDFHAALVDIGLWPGSSTGPATTDLERMLETLVRVQVLREMNQIYLRDSDGSIGSGLAISFPFEQPEAAQYSAPFAGSTLSGAANRYSVMELSVGVGVPSGVLGTAFLDPGNDSHENDGGGTLGVFIDALTSNFESWQGDLDLGSSPVTQSDMPILEALLYGDSMSGPRYDDIRDLLEYYARAIALVTAHEIAHSLGLDHNGTSDTLMAPGIAFGNSQLSSSNAVSLTSGEVSTLGGVLPGPGRNVSALTIFGTEVPETGGEIRYVAIAPGE